MAERVNGTRRQVEELPHSEDEQRLAYINALQSNRVTVHVGPSLRPFHVPQGLLTQCSLMLGEEWHSAGVRGTIHLPEVKEATFEDFFIWLHDFEPRLGTKSFQSVVDLAILAETYNIYHLKNQTSDALWQKFDTEEWELSLDVFSTMYDKVPAGSLLRQLCASTLAIESKRDGVASKPDDYLKLKPVFEKFPELGWDYFVQMQTFATGGACRFHDHSNIPSWERQRTESCPYPHGAPFTISKPAEEPTSVSKSNGNNGDVPSEEVAVASPPPELSPTPEAAPEKVAPDTAAPMSKKDKKRNRKKSMAEPRNVTLVDTSSVTSG